MPAQIPALEVHLPHAKGHLNTRTRLPAGYENWIEGGEASVDEALQGFHRMAGALRLATSSSEIRWPEREIIFLSDAHADAEAFVCSLLSAGVIRKTGVGHCAFKLTKRGKRAAIVVGGDCLDKGPSNIELLKVVGHLRSLGGRLKLLAGNHDLRLFLALQSLSADRDSPDAHFFVRLGSKGIPLLREIFERYLARGHPLLRDAPDEESCRARLYPGEGWAHSFAAHLGDDLSEIARSKELRRVSEKMASFESECRANRLTLRDAYASAMLCRQLFLENNGEFSWFFRNMRLAWRHRSFLFIHAGIDDELMNAITNRGLKAVNHRFRRLLTNDAARCYHGPAANGLRTKYREVDFPLTEKGVDQFHAEGLHFVVHGHRSHARGQQLSLRRGILHVECDITLNRHSRAGYGLDSHGAGVTIIRPEGQIIGLSTDYPRAKVLEPGLYLAPKEVNRLTHDAESQNFSTRIPAGC